MSIRVANQNALSYIENNHFCRSALSNKIRVKECPFCESSSYDVSFNTDTQILTSFCCDKNTNLIDLVKHEQGLRSVRQAIEHLSQFGSTNIVWVKNTENLVSSDSVSSFKVQAIRQRILNIIREKESSAKALDLSNWSTDWETPLGCRLMSYAKKRKVPEWFINSGRLGYFTMGAMRQRLSFLTIENDEAVFSVGRAIDAEREPKYLAIASEELGDDVGSSDFVFNLDLVSEGDFVIVHEGVLSALSGGDGSVATYGKGISDVQLQKIADKKPSGVLFLIEQGVDVPQVVKSAMQMRSKGIYTLTAPLINGDMNDDETQFNEVLSGAVAVNRFSLIKSKLMSLK